MAFASGRTSKGNRKLPTLLLGKWTGYCVLSFLQWQKNSSTSKTLNRDGSREQQQNADMNCANTRSPSEDIFCIQEMLLTSHFSVKSCKVTSSQIILHSPKVKEDGNSDCTQDLQQLIRSFACREFGFIISLKMFQTSPFMLLRWRNSSTLFPWMLSRIYGSAMKPEL